MAAGPPGTNVAVPKAKPVRAQGLKIGPTIASPDESSEIDSLLTVTAGPPAKIVVEPMAKPQGLPVMLVEPPVKVPLAAAPDA